jgi:rhomboid protease GluP
MLLTAAIVLGFVIGLFGDGVLMGCPTLCVSATDLLVQTNGYVVYNRAYYQLFTSIFVTDSAIDAAFNAVAVLVLDRLMDRALNKTRYFAIFFFSALFGNLFTLLNGPSYASAGASGGIFGLFAAAFSFSWAENKKIDRDTLIVFLIIFITSSILPGVDYLAHIGGALAGFVAGPLLFLALKDRITNFESVSESSAGARFFVALLAAFLVVGSAVQFLVFVGA